MTQTCEAYKLVRCILWVSLLCSVSFYLGSLYPVTFQVAPCSHSERLRTPADDLGGSIQREKVASSHVDFAACNCPLSALPPTTPSTSANAYRQRHVFLDMGANWANTLRLYEIIAGTSHQQASYEVYAFEANPFIQTYVDLFVHYLNGRGPKPPLLIPPAGSNGHMRMYAGRYGCKHADKAAMLKCMRKKFANQLLNLPLNTSLNDLGFVAKRLAEASGALADMNKSRFTLIPAAVGAQEGILEMTRVGATHGIMNGGGILAPDGREAMFKVPIVDVVTWMSKYFIKTDYIVMKIDAEGAEHGIFDALLNSGSFAILDVLAYECHPMKSDKCKNLNRRVDAAARSTGALVLREGSSSREYEGLDRYSTPDKYFPVDPQ